MTFLLERLSRVIYKYYSYILAFSLCLAAAAICIISQIKVKTDIMDFLPSNNKSINVYIEALNDFKSMKILTVVILSPDRDIERHLDVVETLGNTFSQSPLIEGSDYNVLKSQKNLMAKYFPLYLDEKGLAALNSRLSEKGMERQIRQNYSKLASVLSTPLDSELILRDPLNIRSILVPTVARNLKSGFTLDMGTGYYISNDHSLGLIFLTPSGSSRDITYVKKLKKDLEKRVNETLAEYSHHDGLEIGFTGVHALSWESHESIVHDMVASVFITAIAIVVIFLFLYSGKLIVIPIILFTLFLSLLWTLTGAYILFGQLNLITAIVSAMLLGLGIDYTLHIYERFREELKKGETPLSALTITFIITGKSVITSGVTTVIAFLSILLTTFRGLHELGIIAALGVISSVISTFVIMGAILIFVSVRWRNYFTDTQEKDSFNRIIVIPFTQKGNLLRVLIPVIIVALLPGTMKITFISDYSSMGIKDSKAITLQKLLSKKIGVQKEPLILIYEGKNNINKAFDKLEITLSQWENIGLISGATSPGTLIPPPHKQKAVLKIIHEFFKNKLTWESTFISLMKKYGFVVKDTEESYIRGITDALNINNVLNLKELVLKGNKKLEYFYNKDKNKLSAYIYPIHKNWCQNEIEKLNKNIRKMGSDWYITGWPLISHELKESIIRESTLSSGMTFILIAFIISLYFKKIQMILYTFAPLISGLIMTMGIMGYTGIGFNYFNVAAIALLFGIAVDYGVYILHACREVNYVCDKKIVINAMKNIIICALTTIAGFGSLITTHFSAITSLGLIIIIGVVSSSFVSLVLPSVMVSFKTSKAVK